MVAKGWSWLDSERLDKLLILVGRLADRYAPEWIRVDDREPPKGSEVLLYHRNPKWIIVGSRHGGTYWAAWYPEMEVNKPTHWLPLPNPPE